MPRIFCGALAVLLMLAAALSAADIQGDYLESRTCDVYTGPCFANSEIGLGGKQALLAWSIERGTHQGVDLSGLKVVLAVRASDTLAYGGGMDNQPEPIESVVLVDAQANDVQRAALSDFARQHAGRVAGKVVRVDAVPIEMSLDHVRMAGRLTAGDEVQLTTRQLTVADHCCTNEEIYYPPLAKVENSAPAFTLTAAFGGRGLGVRWSNPDTRSAFLATFAY